MHLLKKLVVLFLILIIANAGFIWYGQASFDATVKTVAKSFVENNQTVKLSDTEPPKVIAEYIKNSKLDSNKYASIVLQFDGEYRNRPTSKWAKMHALALLRPSADMLWSIRLKSNPIVTFNALETYHNSNATMKMFLFGIVPTGERGGKEFARSELARVLAYGIFNPAILKIEHIEYKVIDTNKILATIKDGNISASVVFTSNQAGDIVEVYSKDRVRPIKGGLQPVKWRIKVQEYGEFDGLRLPSKIEEAWVVDANEFPYSKMRLDSAKRL